MIQRSSKKTGTKYAKHRRVYRPDWFKLCMYFLRTEKPYFSREEIAKIIKLCTWDCKYKNKLFEANVIKPARRGKQVLYAFNERVFWDYLCDEFIKYLTNKLFKVISGFRKYHRAFLKSKRKLMNKDNIIEYLRLSATPSRKTEWIVEMFRRFHRDMTCIESLGKSPLKNEKDHEDDKVSRKDSAKKRLNTMYSDLKTEIEGNPMPFHIKQPPRDQPRKGMFCTFFKAALENKKCEAFCDVFDEIITRWSSQFEIMIDKIVQFRLTNSQVKIGAKPLMLNLETLCYIIKKQEVKGVPEVNIKCKLISGGRDLNPQSSGCSRLP